MVMVEAMIMRRRTRARAKAKARVKGLVGVGKTARDVALDPAAFSSMRPWALAAAGSVAPNRI